jgi:DNA-binding MarR family transcriptional regulator
MSKNKTANVSAAEMDPLQTPSFYIKRLAQELSRLGEAELRPLGLGMGSLPVLTALKEKGPLTQADLTRLLHVEQPSMAQTLARLERDGLILRTQHPESARMKLIELTSRGRNVLPQSKTVLMQGNERILMGFSAAEARDLLAMLKRMHRNLIGDN